MREAESVYPLLGILANIGLVLAGAWVKHVNGSHAALAQLGLLPMQALLATVLVMAGGLMAAKSFVYARFVKHGEGQGRRAGAQRLRRSRAAPGQLKDTAGEGGGRPWGVVPLRLGALRAAVAGGPRRCADPAHAKPARSKKKDKKKPKSLGESLAVLKHSPKGERRTGQGAAVHCQPRWGRILADVRGV